MTISVSLFESASALPGAIVDALGTHATGRAYDRTYEWVRAFEQHFVVAPSRSVVAVAHDASGTAVACLPVLLEDVSSGGRIKSLSNYYSFNAEPAPLVPGGLPDGVGEAIVVALLTAFPRCRAVDLAPIAHGTEFWRSTIAALGTRGLTTEPYLRFGNWWLDMEGRDFAGYLASLPGNVRNTVERKRKKLLKAGRFDMRIVQAPEEVAAAMDDYESVYARSWQRSEAHPQFIRDVVDAFARRGWLRLGVVRLDERPIAAQIWFCMGGSAAIFKLVFDEACAELSPGSVLTTHLLEHVVVSDCATAVDFLSGDDGYKKQWMNRRDEMWGVAAWPRFSVPGLASRARAIARRSRAVFGRARAS